MREKALHEWTPSVEATAADTEGGRSPSTETVCRSSSPLIYDQPMERNDTIIYIDDNSTLDYSTEPSLRPNVWQLIKGPHASTLASRLQSLARCPLPFIVPPTERPAERDSATSGSIQKGETKLVPSMPPSMMPVANENSTTHIEQRPKPQSLEPDINDVPPHSLSHRGYSDDGQDIDVHNVHNIFVAETTNPTEQGIPTGHTTPLDFSDFVGVTSDQWMDFTPKGPEALVASASSLSQPEALPEVSLPPEFEETIMASQAPDALESLSQPLLQASSWGAPSRSPPVSPSSPPANSMNSLQYPSQAFTSSTVSTYPHFPSTISDACNSLHTMYVSHETPDEDIREGDGKEDNGYCIDLLDEALSKRRAMEEDGKGNDKREATTGSDSSTLATLHDHPVSSHFPMTSHTVDRSPFQAHDDGELKQPILNRDPFNADFVSVSNDTVSNVPRNSAGSLMNLGHFPGSGGPNDLPENCMNVESHDNMVPDNPLPTLLHSTDLESYSGTETRSHQNPAHFSPNGVAHEETLTLSSRFVTDESRNVGNDSFQSGDNGKSTLSQGSATRQDELGHDPLPTSAWNSSTVERLSPRSYPQSHSQITISPDDGKVRPSLYNLNKGVSFEEPAQVHHMPEQPLVYELEEGELPPEEGGPPPVHQEEPRSRNWSRFYPDELARPMRQHTPELPQHRIAKHDEDPWHTRHEGPFRKRF
ncbi:hypothetical protein K439DRAFT_1623845 [Ramaria rubella]|nr:hypothetical protein K439DRAFT_1623845 [Ramaria rubella]